MLQKIRVGEIQFPEINLSPSVLHKVRGYFANRFKQYDLLHNHDMKTGKPVYRYPAIQFKKNDYLVIYAFKDEAIDILKKVFLASEQIVVEDTVVTIHEKQIEVKEVSIGEDGSQYLYRFTSPWLALNQDNFRAYIDLMDDDSRRNKLNRILVNNIIAFCKFTGYQVQEHLEIKSRLFEVEANLKGKKLLAFKGEFMVNILLPDFLGLGKSSSRGYGSIQAKM